MPSASNELRERWKTLENALNHLSQNFTFDDGVIRPKGDYTMTMEYLSAMEYCFREWDYEYVGDGHVRSW